MTNKANKFIFEFHDKAIEITVSKTGIARFVVEGMEAHYINLQTGYWVTPTEADIFDTVPIIIDSMEAMKKRLERKEENNNDYK
jgi:hypothetical protein